MYLYIFINTYIHINTLSQFSCYLNNTTINSTFLYILLYLNSYIYFYIYFNNYKIVNIKLYNIYVSLCVIVCDCVYVCMSLCVFVSDKIKIEYCFLFFNLLKIVLDHNTNEKFHKQYFILSLSDFTCISY